MEHESPIMKAWREFALADPEDCEREYDAYITLVNRKAAVSGSSPTNSTSSLHHRAPAAAVTAPSTTRSTAPLSAPSNAMSSTAVSEESASRWDQDDVYPPLAELRRALMTDAEWAAMSEWEKDLWEMKHLPEEERMKSIEGVVMWLPAAQQDQRRKEILEEILRFGEPATTLNSSRTPASTTDTSLVLPVAIQLDVVQDAVDDQAAPTPSTCSTICLAGDTSADLAASAPTTCSADLPSHAASVYAAALIPSSAEPTSSTTTACVSEQCCFDPEPVVAILTPTSAPDLLECVDDLSSTSPSVGLSLWSSGGIGTTALLSVKVFTVHKLIGVLLPATEIKRPPWPPPFFVSFQDVIKCKDMIQVLLSDDLVLKTQLMLRAAKNPCPPPIPNMCTGIQNILQLDCQDIPFMSRTTLLPLHSQSVELIRSRIGMWLCCFCSRSAELLAFCLAACRISNLDITVDIMQISGDWQSLRTVQIECNPTLTVIIFALGIQSVQLQPLVFEWSYLLWVAIHFLSSSTLNVLLARRAAHFVWKSCCVDNLHRSFGGTNWAVEEEKGHMLQLLSISWPSLRCHWVAYHILLWKLPTSHPHEDPDGFAGSFVLHWTSFSDGNQMHLLIAAETFYCKLFAIWETGDCLQYEHLQQWRPPDQLTSVACMGAFFLRFKDCWSDIHWAQLFVIEHWLIPWEPGNDSRGHNLMIWFTITCELLYSVDDNLQTDRYLCWYMRCVQVDTDGSRSCVSFLQPKPPWLILAPTIYASGFKSNLTIASESMHITSISLEINQCGATAIHGSRAYGCLDVARKLMGQNFICLLGLYSTYAQYITQDIHYFGFQQTATSSLPKKQPIGGHCKFYDAFLFSWDLTSTIDSVPAVKYISGGSVPVLDSATCVNWNSTPQPFLHLTWDPGGSTQHRLEGKPNFKEGGMLATLFPISLMGWTVGFLSWAWAYQKPPKAATTYTRGFVMVNSAWIRTASASLLLSPFPLLFVFLCFSSVIP